jgi:hypothetical protein
VTMENISQSPQAVNRTESDKMSDIIDLSKMSDKKLVNYVGERMVKFLVEIRPGLIELHSRFTQRRAQGRPFMGYTNWDVFCEALLHYTGRDVNRIISGEAFKKPKALPQQTIPTKRSKPLLADKALWTDHDYVTKVVTDIKEMLRPLESQPKRYAKVTAAVVEELSEDTESPDASDKGEDR